MADHLASRLANMNPFSKSGSDEDEDVGGRIGADTIGGGGRHNRMADRAKDELRVSHALRSFLVEEQVLSEEDAGLDKDEPGDALRRLLSRASFTAPEALLDRSHPLPEYFISSSHNTYLVAHQLYGTSSASAYETALRTGSRCVEIDAWDNAEDEDEPKVTHGYTLVSHVPFRDVCETIRDVFDEELSAAAGDSGYAVAPIMVSLENHCGEHGQLRLVDIMKEVFGDRLLSEAVRHAGHREQEGTGGHVRLADLGPRITVIVEYRIPGEADDSDFNSSDESNPEEEAREARKAYEESKKEGGPASTIIIPELAELGVYAQSVKPTDNSWYDPGQLINGPHHHLINVSESGLSKHLPACAVPISRHNAHHLMRVYPKGTRIGSSNLKPVAFWGVGAQLCALNWQTFSTSNQLNDALFNGSEGYVLKPAALRADGDGNIGTGRKKRLRLHVAGATDIPLDEDREAESIKPYLTCNLYSPCSIDGDTPKRKTAPFKHHRLAALHHGENPPATDPVWSDGEPLEWVYEDNELVFLRMLIKGEDAAWVRNPMFAVAAVRLLYAVPGWSFIRMMDMKGRETKCTVLVCFEIEDAEEGSGAV
ncbi:Phosphoinositide phospholipase C [Tolypocladium capitatum]|uniref:Phosphoinositide phospholipase C n=1 Tax=Tolypocladium capitatum TaxID=45235 RepID=A0A2K3QNM6_9HYPO|nr:Phosphoinositide phospholipase C [Tolypocladium capitatum]